MGVVVAFGLGLLLGGFAAFGGGRRFERAHQASMLAAEHFGAARQLTGQAVGGVFLFVVVVVLGAVVIWAGR
ncbi:hypothetical protein [Actinoplanes sp. N902-109]|uniref:hypothetical protein n=1 Tax=Actinoplanes sp. (strain N902-109) TaxID=649831 RepID=UPI0003AA4715|nr:hypothetical protein [Actinoplanes sp. N902-109]